MKKWLEFVKKLNTPKFIVWFFVLVAFILRLLPWNSIIINWGKSVIFVQPDAYYQMRRAMIWATNFPKLITMDYYMAYPFGAECPWSPLYNFVMAVLTLIFSGGKPNQQVLHLVTALLPPIIAAFCVIPVYKIVKLVWKNERIALFSAFFAIIMPGMLGYSTIGSGDHHVAETFLFLWFFYYSLFLLKKILNREENLSKDIVKTGIMVALGLLIWPGQVVFFTVWAIYLSLLVLINHDKSELCAKISKSFFYAAVIGSGIGIVVRFILPISTEQAYFDFAFFSYFQPVYVLFIFLSVVIIHYALVRIKKNRKEFFKAVILVSIVFVFLAFIPPLRKGVINGVNFLLKTDPWHSSINEFQSTFSIRLVREMIMSKAIQDIGYLVSFLFPICFSLLYFYNALRLPQNKIWFSFYNDITIKKPEKILLGLYNIVNKPDQVAKEERKTRTLLLFYGVSGIMLGFLALYQKRWTNAFSPILAIGIALFANAVYLKIKGGHGFFKEFIKWRREKKKIKEGIFTRLIVYWEKSPFFLSLACVVVVLLPYFYIAGNMLKSQGYPIQSDLYNSLIWIKNYTPKTSYLWKPDKKPEYGILAAWDHGHYIQYIAERPAIVNNFGHSLRGDGFKTANYVWSCESEDELVSIIEKYNIRFLFLNDFINYINSKYSVYFKPGFIEKNIDFQQGHFGESIPIPNENFFTLPLPRLWIFDGSSTSFGSALRHFRLVFESENPAFVQYFNDRELKLYKMFEYVKGAKVVGKAAPKSIVFITAHFITNFDREFDWNAAAIADENGNFNAVLPYATAEDNFFIKPLSPYLIYSDGKVVELNITNNDVYQGKNMSVDVTKGEKAPKDVENEVKDLLKNIVGQVKTPGYLNIHKKVTKEEK